MRAVFLAGFVMTLALPTDAAGTEWFVAAGGTGRGSPSAPFGSIQAALAVAQPGDIVTVRDGEYRERLFTRRHGTASARIILRAAAGRGSVVVTVPNQVLQVDHAYHTFDGLVFDAQYAQGDVIVVDTAATGFVLRNSEVRRTSWDCVDLGSPSDVLIDRSMIHHCLNAAAGRTDAHGIVAGAVRDLIVRDTEIHTFSGDALQLDPDRRRPGWDQVTVERCRFWLAPLSERTNGFAAGTVPGENAIDTKARANASRARLVIRDTVASGFRGGAINNMAAFNLKENIDALIDAVTVHDSDVAFRVRGPGARGAWVRIQNAVIYGVERAIRYEDDIERLQVFNTTIGANVARAFQAVESRDAGLFVRNVLVLAKAKPRELSHVTNLAATPRDFADVQRADYQLTQQSVAIDAGTPIAGIGRDRTGVARPQGKTFDVGAFEFSRGPKRIE